MSITTNSTDRRTYPITLANNQQAGISNSSHDVFIDTNILMHSHTFRIHSWHQFPLFVISFYFLLLIYKEIFTFNSKTLMRTYGVIVANEKMMCNNMFFLFVKKCFLFVRKCFPTRGKYFKYYYNGKEINKNNFLSFSTKKKRNSFCYITVTDNEM